MEKTIEELINGIDLRAGLNGVERFPYLPYNMNLSLRVIEAMGRKRKAKFRIDDENRFVFENLIRWVHADPEMKSLNPETLEVVPGELNSGIYIAGNTGTGKSWVLELMSAYCLIDNVQVFVGKKRQLHWENFRTDIICDEYVETGSSVAFKKRPILGLQDFGSDSEPRESLFMGNRISVIQQLLECRGDRTDLITLISSNLPMSNERIRERYGERVASRLNEMCNYFELTGMDRRKL